MRSRVLDDVAVDRPRFSSDLVLAALVSALVYLSVSYLTGDFPLGDKPINFGDHAWQFVPFYAQLWDVLHRETISTLLFSWNLGLGVPFFSEYLTYLGGLFAPLIALFPREQIVLGMFCIVGLKLILAAVSMALLLRYFSPSAPLGWRVFLAVVFSQSGWVWDVSIHRIMWLDVLIFLPLLALGVIWSARRQHYLVVVLLIALTIWSNYYVAFMACIAAGIFAICYAAANAASVRGAVKDVLYFAGQGALGALASAIVLLPPYIALKYGISAAGPGATPWTVERLRQLATATTFPAVSVFPSLPSIFVTTIVVGAVAAFLFAAHLSNRVKAVWGISLLLVLFSQLWERTMVIWNVFDSPNGTWFRPAFVSVFFLLLIASLAVARNGLTSLQVLIAFVTLIVLFVVAYSQQFEERIGSTLLLRSSLIGILAIFLLWQIFWKYQAARIAAATLVIAIGSSQLIHYGVAARTFQHSPVSASDRGQEQIYSLAASVRKQSLAANQRVAIYGAVSPYNVSAVANVLGTTFYSSLTPAVLGYAIPINTGNVTSGSYRMVALDSDPGSLALASVNYVLRLARVNGGYKVEAENKVVGMPFARHLPPGTISPEKDTWYSKQELGFGNSGVQREQADKYAVFASEALLGNLPADAAPTIPVPTHTRGPLEKVRSQIFANRNVLLGGDVYVPAKDLRVDGVPVDKVRNLSNGEHSFTADCPNGTLLSLATSSHIMPTAEDATVFPMRAGAQMGVVTAAKQGAPVKINAYKGPEVPKYAACYSPQVVEDIARKGGVESSFKGSSIKLSPSSTEPIFLATAALPGWSCQNGKVGNLMGFLTVVPNSAAPITCSYATPGLKLGAIISAATWVLLIAVRGAIYMRKRNGKRYAQQ